MPFTITTEKLYLLILFFYLFICFFLIFFSTFIYFWDRETEHERGRGRERGRHRIGSRLRAISPEPDAGLELTDREIVTWLKSDA